MNKLKYSLYDRKMNKKKRKNEILGVKIDNISFQEAIRIIDNFIKNKKPHQIVTVNPEFIIASLTNGEFKKILNRADLVCPDGIGVLWAGRLLKTPFKERITGTDLVWEISKLAKQKGYSIYLLGAGEGVAEKVAKRLKSFFPKLRIVGYNIGEPKYQEKTVISTISQSGTDILFVAYGSPKQEKFIAKNLDKLGVKVAMGVGGAFDYISGKIPRAPFWLRKIGLEWFYRLLREPKRFNRILTATIRFPLAIIKEKYFK